MLYFNTNKPHSFFCRIPVVLEAVGHLRGGGGGTPCTLPLDPPLPQLFAAYNGQTEGVKLTITDHRSFLDKRPGGTIYTSNPTTTKLIL